MPREIDCPDCATDGEIFDEDLSLWVDCQTCDTTGKITVYTQAEINEAVKQEKEECALICENRLYQNWEECANAIRAKGE